MARLRKPKRAKKRATRSTSVKRAEYHALAAKVDAFFDRVHTRYASEMKCAAGCSECCAHHFTVSMVEAADIAALLAKRTPKERERLAARAAALGEGEGPCPALDHDGRCSIYEARPLICRSHGAPMHVANPALPVLAEEDAEGSLKVCHLNFTERTLDTVDPDCVLDLVNMAATLAVVNARATGEGQSAALKRTLIGDVLRASSSR